jgi:hypothetical protein
MGDGCTPSDYDRDYISVPLEVVRAQGRVLESCVLRPLVRQAGRGTISDMINAVQVLSKRLSRIPLIRINHELKPFYAIRKLPRAISLVVGLNFYVCRQGPHQRYSSDGMIYRTWCTINNTSRLLSTPWST